MDIVPGLNMKMFDRHDQIPPRLRVYVIDEYVLVTFCPLRTCNDLLILSLYWVSDLIIRHFQPLVYFKQIVILRKLLLKRKKLQERVMTCEITTTRVLITSYLQTIYLRGLLCVSDSHTSNSYSQGL